MWTRRYAEAVRNAGRKPDDAEYVFGVSVLEELEWSQEGLKIRMPN